MTPQEQKMLDDLMARVDSTRLDEKDPEAAQRIEEWSAAQPGCSLHPGADGAGAELCAGAGEGADSKSAAAGGAASGAAAAGESGAAFWEIFSGTRTNRVSQPHAPAYAQPQPQQGYAPVPQYAAPQQYGQRGLDTHRRRMARRRAIRPRRRVELSAFCGDDGGRRGSRSAGV